MSRWPGDRQMDDSAVQTVTAGCVDNRKGASSKIACQKDGSLRGEAPKVPFESPFNPPQHPSTARRPSLWHYFVQVSSPPLEVGRSPRFFSLRLVGDARGQVDGTT